MKLTLDANFNVTVLTIEGAIEEWSLVLIQTCDSQHSENGEEDKLW